MTDFLNALPPFWSQAISDPQTWTFWGWIGYVASLVAILALIWQVLRLINRWLIWALFPLATWGTKLRIKTANDQMKTMANQLEEALRWAEQPNRLAAAIVRMSVKSMMFLAGGFLALLALPEIFNLLLGVPLVGLALLSFSVMYEKMYLVIDRRKYVDIGTKRIEKSFRAVEKSGMAGPDLTELIADMRNTLVMIKNLAIKIDEVEDTDSTHPEAVTDQSVSD